MNKKTIVVGCDNAAVSLKNEMIKILAAEGFDYEDVGVMEETDQAYYPAVAAKVCESIIESAYEKEGLLICGTGIGMAMTANKFPGIYASVCHDNYSAERARLSNNGNLMCMGARIIGVELAKKILREWLMLSYETGGRSQPKIDLMHQIDQTHRK